MATNWKSCDDNENRKRRRGGLPHRPLIGNGPVGIHDVVVGLFGTEAEDQPQQ